MATNETSDKRKSKELPALPKGSPIEQSLSAIVRYDLEYPKVSQEFRKAAFSLFFLDSLD
jgi:hypothetical protein